MEHVPTRRARIQLSIVGNPQGQSEAHPAMNRRNFLKVGAASLAFSALGSEAQDVINQKPKRVGLIGCGWYGKADLLRLIQVAPVEVVSQSA